jgi:hypothetical protein
MKTVRLYALNFLIGLDEWVNTWTGGAPGDTISGRACRAHRAGRPRWLCIIYRVLDYFFPGHCERSLKDDMAGRHVEAEPVG